MRQIVFDTETTGLEPEQGHRIIEIGAVEIVNRRRTGRQFHRYLCPDREVDAGALQVHGLSNEFLASQPRFAEIAQELRDFIADAELIIHNAPFDIAFLNKELERLGRKPIKAYIDGVIDTLVMAKEMFPGKRNGLDALCDRLEVDNSSRTLHGALLDAELLADVYINMTRGQDALIVEEGTSSEVNLREELVLVDLSRLELPVLTANEQEAAAHDAVLADIDKACKGKTLWRQLSPAA